MKVYAVVLGKPGDQFISYLTDAPIGVGLAVYEKRESAVQEKKPTFKKW